MLRRKYRAGDLLFLDAGGPTTNLRPFGMFLARHKGSVPIHTIDRARYPGAGARRVVKLLDVLTGTGVEAVPEYAVEKAGKIDVGGRPFSEAGGKRLLNARVRWDCRHAGRQALGFGPRLSDPGLTLVVRDGFGAEEVTRVDDLRRLALAQLFALVVNPDG